MKTPLLTLAMVTCLAFLVGCQSGNQAASDPTNSSSTESSIVLSQDSTSLTDNDKGEVESIVRALSGSLMLGKSWTSISGEEYKYDLSLTTFYCIMNPNSPAEIPAVDYEAFIQKYFTVTADALHEMSDYDKSKNTYTVSPDILIDRAVTQSAEVLKIDSTELQSDGTVKVMYRSIWGKMASSGDGSDTAFAGNILLEIKNDGYKVKSVEVTEDNADKYAG